MPLISTSRASIWIADGRHAPDEPVLVLLHGAGGSRLQWPSSLRQLPGIGVIAVDLPGHGSSPTPGRDSISAYAADIVALLDALDIQRAVFAGHSMGGAIALQLALDYPDRTQGLILMGTGAKLSVHPDLLRDAQENPSQAARTMVEWVWSEATPAEAKEKYYEAIVNLPPDVLHGDFVACNTFDVRERLSNISAPTLIISATKDRMTPPKYSAYLHEQIPDSQLVSLEASHMLMLEQPEATGNAVRQWLNLLTK